MNWLLLILSLPTENTTVRMRAWRAIKAVGVATLRDGVYLLPERPECRAAFDAIAEDVNIGGGNTYQLTCMSPDDVNFPALFNRDGEYSVLLNDINTLRDELTRSEKIYDGLKRLRKLRKAFAQLTAIDYFANAAQPHTQAALSAVETLVNRMLSPDEPLASAAAILQLNIADYQHKLWATRTKPWVDRLASAWLIKRFIDNHADFLWLETIEDCPTNALGFDFEGASFSHVGDLVTFEVLLKSFNLQQAALTRVAAIVHFLDVGGTQPSEAPGIERLLIGLRSHIADDEPLLSAASIIFDNLFNAFALEDEYEPGIKQ